MDDAVLLRKTELFGGLDDGAMAEILSQVGRLTLKRGGVICRDGEIADRLFVVRSGRAVIAKRSPDGKESIVALMEPGDVFGELPLFDGQPRSAAARAVEATELLVVPYEPVKAVLIERPVLLWHMVALLARRLRASDAALADSMLLDVPGRTAKRLLELAGGNDQFVLPVTQEELAGMVGASRERVNKALAQFVRLGWLSAHDRLYVITNRAELERRAR